MANANAYFDESGVHEDAKDLCLAGYIFLKVNVRAFDYEWRAMLSNYKLAYHHMKEIAMLKGGVYGHLDEQQRDFAAREAIRIIKTYASQGIAISADKIVASGLREHSHWRNAYSFISNQPLFGVRNWAERTGFNDDVAYIFEAGAEGFGQALEAARLVMQNPNLCREFRLESFSSGLKAEETPLQAADMLAWHWAKYQRNLRQGNRVKRKDFKSLLELPTDVHHYDESAVRHLNAIRNLTPEQLEKMSVRDAALRRT